ncbi:MAG: hypothetical protein ACFFBD_14160 [Candidatus Hodarchaeota archaeon]
MMELPQQLEEGVYKIPLILPKSLQSRSEEFQNVLIEAQKRVKKFANQFYWKEEIKRSFADKCHIFDSKADFDQTLIRIFGLDCSTKLPKTFCAALESRVLLAVSPELYAEAYPEGIEEGSYEKLLAHEMVHRLHIRILKGNEDAMGSIWFYEGFAIYGSGQFEDSSTKLPSSEIWDIVQQEKRLSYKKYGTVFRYFLNKASLHELVEQAGKKTFTSWLAQFKGDSTV